jgi:glycosyltransferase involved in cell wall biosynthesis
VILEAMSAARPVVATRVGGAPELVQRDSGILVEPRRSSELADAIDRMIADPAAARVMGRRGRAFVEGRYSLDRMAAAVQDLYGQLVDVSATAHAA